MVNFLPCGLPCNFYWQLDVIYQIKGTAVNRPLVMCWCEKLTYLKRPWCWKRLKMGGEGDNRGWDGLMASPTQWTWVWVSYRSWWWTGKPGMLQSMGSQRFGHDWVTELKWLNVLVRGWGEKVFCGPTIRSQFCSEPVSLSWDSHKCFSPFFNPSLNGGDD